MTGASFGGVVLGGGATSSMLSATELAVNDRPAARAFGFSADLERSFVQSWWSSWSGAIYDAGTAGPLRAHVDFEEGRWLLRALRSGTHVELGFGSFYEYTERLFGYGPRLTQEKIRVAEALAELPDTAEALKTGSISFSAARELTRVAVPATEREWLAVAQGRTVRDVEELVSGHRPGSLPDDVPDASVKRHVLRLEAKSTRVQTSNLRA